MLEENKSVNITSYLLNPGWLFQKCCCCINAVTECTGSVCDQKTSKFFVPCGGTYGRTHGCNVSLFKVREREHGGAQIDLEAEKVSFSSPGAFKTCAHPWEGQNQLISHATINEGEGQGWN
jgi:hypothetical protein